MFQVFVPRSVILKDRPSAPESNRSIRLPFGALAILATPGSDMTVEFLRGMTPLLILRAQESRGDMGVTR